MTEDVVIQIDGRRWRGWSDLEIRLPLDGFATFSFLVPFEPERADFREVFRPFSYRRVDVSVNGEQLFAGTMVDVAPTSEVASRSVSVSGYSLPGVLADCTPPVSSFPLEFNGLTLTQIADRLASPFGIDVVRIENDGATFRRPSLEPGSAIMPFLAELAKQRGLVASATAQGSLCFIRSTNAGSPVARLREGVPPLQSTTPTFSPQAYFSEITGLAKRRSGRRGSAYTVDNAKLPGVLRPSTFSLDDTDSPDLPAATRARMGRMFANAASYAVTVPTWRDAGGALWAPNTTLTLEAPGAMVYRETELIVREVTLRHSASSIDASLVLVLPGAFSGEIPTVLPWE